MKKNVDDLKMMCLMLEKQKGLQPHQPQQLQQVFC
jgi:hypothetical protein